MMDQLQLRSEYTRLLQATELTETFEIIEIYKNYLFDIFRQLKRTKDDTIAIADAKMIPQMMFTKLLHLEQVCHGITYQTRDRSVNLNPIIDPTVVGTLTRAIFESVSVFNLIYISPKGSDEQSMLYYLWVISGLKYRQRFVDYLTSEEVKEKSRKEKIEIDRFINMIETNPLYLSCSEKGRQQIQYAIRKKKFAFYFENGEPLPLDGFQDMVLRAGFRKKIMGEMYTYFSLSAHPSNVAVFQFAQMFDKSAPEFDRTTVFDMKNVFLLLSAFIADLGELFPETKNTYNNLPILDQCIINHFNIFARDETYSINNCLHQLG